MNNSHIHWANHFLKENDYQISSSAPDIVQDNPWAQVCRFKTNKGYIFLKRVPNALAIEAKIIEVLKEEYYVNTPQIIAVNDEKHCFLMLSAGIQLHDYLKSNFQADLIVRLLNDYINLQIKSSEDINDFFDLGIPDWRLEKLPHLYEDLLSQEKLLLDDGLTKEEILSANELYVNLQSICDKLSRYKIKETFCHADFHDKNILIDENTLKMTFIDLGEVVITHPFFSLNNFLYRAAENFSIEKKQHDRTYGCRQSIIKRSFS